ncbi:MAG: IPTL-CTERM sorting domain-containing protein, partial [Acidobacteriota bacterium]
MLEVDAPPAGACTPGPTSATYAASDSNLTGVAAWLDGEPYASGAEIGDGVHELVVRATDSCDNVSEEVHAFTVDSAPPVLDVVAPSPGSCVAGPASATYAATDPTLESLLAWLDGEPYPSGAPIGDGSRQLRVRAEDACAQAAEDERSFTVDSEAPVIEVTGVEDNGSYGGPVTVEWRAVDDNLTSARAWLNGLEIDPIHAVEVPGTYVLTVDAADCAGGAASLEWVFVIEIAVDPLEIPTLNPVALLLLAALLAGVGVSALRRRGRPGGVAMDTLMDRRRGRGGPPMDGRLMMWLGAFAALLGAGALAPPVSAQDPAGSARGCPQQFDGVRSWLASPDKAPPTAALLDELEIEAAIWRDEFTRRNAELDAGAGRVEAVEKGGVGDARGRLAALDAEITGQLDALRAAVSSGDSGAARGIADAGALHDLWR